MPTPPAGPLPARQIRFRRLLLLALSAVAGYVDVLSYTQFGRVFVANMTGNTVLLGIALAGGDGRALLQHALAIVGFMGGAAFGTWVGHGRDARSGLRRGLAVEIALLVVVAAGWTLSGDATPGPAVREGLIAAASAAMGVQSAAAQRIDVLGISTTYLTGMLTRLSTLAFDRAVGEAPPREPSPRFAPSPDAVLLAATWGVYVGGAAAAAAVLLVTKSWAVLVPIAVLVAMVVRWPARLRPAAAR